MLEGSLVLVIDSVDTMLADSGSRAHTISTLSHIFGRIVKHSNSSRLVLPIILESPLLPYLTSTTFRALVQKPDGSRPAPIHTLIHSILHPPVLLSYLVQQYHLTLPPVDTAPEVSTSRFWSVFIPVTRRHVGERLVMSIGVDELGTPGVINQLSDRDQTHGVIEMRIRSRTGGQKGIRTVLRGWRFDPEFTRVTWCGWGDIPALREYATQRIVSTRNLSFII